MVSGHVLVLFDKNYNKFRYLTPRECANIQSFPKTFKLSKNDLQAYKQFGNAVNVKVIKYVVDKLIKLIM